MLTSDLLGGHAWPACVRCFDWLIMFGVCLAEEYSSRAGINQYHTGVLLSQDAHSEGVLPTLGFPGGEARLLRLGAFSSGGRLDACLVGTACFEGAM